MNGHRGETADEFAERCGLEPVTSGYANYEIDGKFYRHKDSFLKSAVVGADLPGVVASRIQAAIDSKKDW